MNIAWIGAGKMTYAFLKGFSSVPSSEFIHHISTAHPEKFNEWHQEFNFIQHPTNRDCVKHADVIILAVKPQILKAVIEDLRSVVPSHALVVSIAAAVDLSLLHTWFNRPIKLARLMPNTAVAIRKGSMALSGSQYLNEDDLQTLEQLFKPLGSLYRLDESLMNAFIASSGSGIAFVYSLMDAFIQASIQQGLNPDQAQSISLETFQAALMMAQASKRPISNLIDDVCSKGGTTIEGINVLNQTDLVNLFNQTFKATIQKAEALNDGFKSS